MAQLHGFKPIWLHASCKAHSFNASFFKIERQLNAPDLAVTLGSGKHRCHTGSYRCDIDESPLLLRTVTSPPLNSSPITTHALYSTQQVFPFSLRRLGSGYVGDTTMSTYQSPFKVPVSRFIASCADAAMPIGHGSTFDTHALSRQAN